MNDEATSHYSAIIQNMGYGLQWLLSTFGMKYLFNCFSIPIHEHLNQVNVESQKLLGKLTPLVTQKSRQIFLHRWEWTEFSLSELILKRKSRGKQTKL